MTTNPATAVHTAGNAIPPLDDQLAGLLDDLAGAHPGIDLIRDGVRLIALDRLTADKTQTLAVTLAGSPDSTDVLTLIGQLVARICDADTNPNLRQLPLDQQEQARKHSAALTYQLDDPDLHQHAAEAAAAIDGI